MFVEVDMENESCEEERDLDKLLEERKKYLEESARHKQAVIAHYGETILRLGAEGGSITLFGKRKERGWAFRCYDYDWTPQLLDEPSIEHESDAVETWEAAMTLLDDQQYCWHSLGPVVVHPEFREAVLREVLRRHESDPVRESRLDDWKIKCRKSVAD